MFPKARSLLLAGFPEELFLREHGSPLEKWCPDAEGGRAGRVVDELANKPLDARASNTKRTVISARKTLCRRKPANRRP
jgi:hypothetical protein